MVGWMSEWLVAGVGGWLDVAGRCITLPSFAGTFLTSTSSQCYGMAPCSGSSLSLCSWEHLFQTGFMLCSELLGPHSSTVIWLPRLFLVPVHVLTSQVPLQGLVSESRQRLPG